MARSSTIHALCIAGALLAGAPPRASAQAPAPRPKVVVVVAGDPDAALRATAAALDGRLEEEGTLLLPGDPAVGAALRGEPPPSDEDGLARLRAERRRLGWDERGDTAVLANVGRMTGAHLVLRVRRSEGGIVVEAFDVGARAFYEGRPTLTDPPSSEVVAFVARAAQASLRRASRPPRGAAEAPSPAATAAGSSASPIPSPAEAATQAPGATEDHPALPHAAGSGEVPSGAPPADLPADDQSEKTRVKRFMRHNWPYFVAAALLAGAVTAVVMSRHQGSTPPPVLRFRPGG